MLSLISLEIDRVRFSRALIFELRAAQRHFTEKLGDPAYLGLGYLRTFLATRTGPGTQQLAVDVFLRAWTTLPLDDQLALFDFVFN